MTKLNVVWDMETQDPDDFITLLLLLGHPQINLKAVTVTPGSQHQIGLVRRALDWFGVKIPVGANNLNHPKECVSSWHYRAYGEAATSKDAEPGGEVIFRECDKSTTLITGGPLKNLGAAMKKPGFRVGRLVAQGGFAGEGVVPRERQLEKFKGLTTCPTFNLNGDPGSALAALTHPGISSRYFVSKNVCHGVIYDLEMHQKITAKKEGSLSLELIWKGMDAYLEKRQAKLGQLFLCDEEITAPAFLLIDEAGQKLGVLSRQDALRVAQEKNLSVIEVAPEQQPAVCRLIAKAVKPKAPTPPAGKKFHDPLAACCAIDPQIGTWAEVELYRSKGGWGSRLAKNTNTWIITDYSPARFFEVLTAKAL
jgi:inosine-uridine nucleoside N-ribohydrolase